MPSPSDPTNLVPNLQAIASASNVVKARLAYDSNTARFSVQPNTFGTSIARTFSSDSVTSEASFGAPIRQIFASAHAQVGTNGVTPDLVTQALNGLKNLRNTYPSDEIEKRGALERVIEDVPWL
jgi:hypothetical protein